MINRILVTLILLSVTLASGAADLTARADSAYSHGDYAGAEALYRKALSEGSSAELYYNIGNAAYRQGHPGQAVLNYERALRLDPAMKDARANLEFVNGRLTDRPGERGTFLGNAFDAAAAAAHSNTWAWLAFGCFALFIGGLALYFFASGVMLRKVGFFGGGAMFLGFVVFIILSFRGASIAKADNVAIVTAGSTILSTSPRQPASREEEAMLLHEGTRVEILDSVASPSDSVPSVWLDVMVDNDHRAWLNSRDAERVVAPIH